MTDATAHTKSYPAALQTFTKTSQDLASAQSDVMRAFWKLHAPAMADGALDAKTKELIALAISVALRCDDCIAHHTFDALKAGASHQEIADALGVAILMGGGTSVAYATHAITALQQFAEATG